MTLGVDHAPANEFAVGLNPGRRQRERRSKREPGDEVEKRVAARIEGAVLGVGMTLLVALVERRLKKSLSGRRQGGAPPSKREP